MGNSSTKLAEKCSLLSKDEIPLVASSFKLVSKNSERIKEDDLMVCTFYTHKNSQSLHIIRIKYENPICKIFSLRFFFAYRNSGDHRWTPA